MKCLVDKIKAIFINPKRLIMNFLHFANALFFAVVTGLTGCVSSNNDTPVNNLPAPDETELETYQNASYDFSMEIPESWRVVENPDQVNNGQAINIFPPDQDIADDLPKNVHGDAGSTYLAIWPKGFGTELPSGSSGSFAEASIALPALNIVADKEKSQVFYLKNQQPWAFFIIPQSPPASWSDMGFIYAQYGVANFTATCYDKTTGEVKDIKNCDPMEGDRFVREGNVMEEEAARVNKMLESIRFSSATKKSKDQSEYIRVSSPLPNMDIQSPLTVKGEAVGYWFFEGSFPIRLYDSKGNLLAETNAEAQGKWMTESFVPFEAKLSFKTPGDESGKLVLLRSNPSGLPENDMEYSIPVIFTRSK